MIKFLSKLIIFIFILSLICAAALLSFIYFNAYKPEAISHVHISNPQPGILIQNQQYTLTSFQIGHATMSAQTDQSSAIQNTSEINTVLNNISKTLLELNSDFYTLQDVDTRAKRTLFIDQRQLLSSAFTNYSSTFAHTHQASYIPFPFFKPIGQLESGLLTLSRYHSLEQKRIALPREATFFKELTTPHLAILESSIEVRGNKQLIIAQLSLTDGEKQVVHTDEHFLFIDQYLQSLLKEGYYVILGGDWNHLLTNPAFKAKETWPEELKKIPSSFTPDSYTWATQSSVPTYRSMVAPYEKDGTFVGVTDGFLVSSNIDIISTIATDMQFSLSHHQPVTMTFILK